MNNTMRFILLISSVIAVVSYHSICGADSHTKSKKISYFLRVCKGDLQTYTLIAGFDDNRICFLTMNSGEKATQPKCPAVMIEGELYVVKSEINHEDITHSESWWVMHNDKVVFKGKIRITKNELLKYLEEHSPESLINKLKM